MVSRIATLRELDAAGARASAPRWRRRGSSAGRVVLRHYLTGREERIEDCAALLWVGAARARNGLFPG